MGHFCNEKLESNKTCSQKMCPKYEEEGGWRAESAFLHWSLNLWSGLLITATSKNSEANKITLLKKFLINISIRFPLRAGLVNFLHANFFGFTFFPQHHDYIKTLHWGNQSVPWRFELSVNDVITFGGYPDLHPLVIMSFFGYPPCVGQVADDYLSSSALFLCFDPWNVFEIRGLPKISVTRPNWPRKVRKLIRVLRGQGVGLQFPRFPGGQWVGLQGPRASRGRPIGSQGVKG